MLEIRNITYAIGGRRLFEDASARIPQGHKIGFVGPNGTGKSTLFDLILGNRALEGGDIILKSGARIGQVAQEAPATQISLLETVLAADQERTALLSEKTSDPTRIAEIQTRLTDIDAWSAEARAATILRGLGFDEAAQARPCADFSGGWRMRVALAGALFSRPDLLLLDEPTNYLDLEGALWLESYLAKYPYSVLIISHDRDLLNRAVGAILHLEAKKLTLYQGGFDQFLRQRAEQQAQNEALAKKQDAKRAHLQSYVDRFRYKADKAKQAQSRLKALERLQPISLRQDRQHFAFSFPDPESLAAPIIRLEDVSVGYGDLCVLSGINQRIDPEDRIALLGRNGMGKSTLAKLLSGELQSKSGQIISASKLKYGYFAQHQLDALRHDETPLEHLRLALPDQSPTLWRSRLASFGLGPEQADLQVAQLSGGQRARLSLLLVCVHAPHLLILDEPTNHLDIESRQALLEALTAYRGAVILISHDMHLLEHAADRLWLVSDGKVTTYKDDLEAYRKFLLSDASRDIAKTGKDPVKSGREIDEKSKRRAQIEQRDRHKSLQAAERKSAARVEKLEQMRAELSLKLADPENYSSERSVKLEFWQEKYAEVQDALARAEALWMADLERLEASEHS